MKLFEQLFGDSPRDPRLADAIRGAERRPSLRSDDALRARIVQAAGPLLVRLRARPRAWWEWTATWARTVVPIGLAASLAAGVLLVRTAESGSYGASDTAAVSRARMGSVDTADTLLLNVATGVTSVAEVADEVVAQPSDDWLFTQVMNDNRRIQQ